MLHEDKNTFLIISRSVILRVRSVSDKGCRENKKKHFMFSKFFPRKSSVGVMWNNSVEPDKSQMTIKYGACALHAAY
jgi:hypothetical protein